MFFRMVYKSGPIFLPFYQGSRVWQTDRQTDRRTDGRTEISSQYRVCITCSAVKNVSPLKILAYLPPESHVCLSVVTMACHWDLKEYNRWDKPISLWNQCTGCLQMKRAWVVTGMTRHRSDVEREQTSHRGSCRSSRTRSVTVTTPTSSYESHWRSNWTWPSRAFRCV